MKRLVGSIAVGFLLAGCGGVEMEANASAEEPTVVTMEQGICEGWSQGARWCTAKCGGTWYYVGNYPYIGNGDCTAAGDNFCMYHFGVWSSGACWSY